MKKYLGLICLLLALCLLVPLTVLASYEYYIPITVYNNNSEALSGVPVLISINNSQLASLGYIAASGLDTAMLEGSNDRSYLVADNKTVLIVPSIDAYQERTYNYRLGNSPAQTFFNFSAGHGGYVTVGDDADLELGNNFSIEFTGYVPSSQTEDQPAVVSYNTSTEDVETSPHTVDLPLTYSEGDLLLVLFSSYDGDPTTHTITCPTGWSELANEDGARGNSAIFYKTATGSEGTTVSVTTSRDVYSAHHSFSIENWAVGPTVSAVAEGSSTHPDSDELSVAWGGNTLWFSVFMESATDGNTVTAYPANYEGGMYVEDSGDNCNVGSAHRDLSALSEDPGEYTVDNSDSWDAYTIAIGGTAPLVSKGEAFYVHAGGGNCTAGVLDTFTANVTALSLSEGSYNFTVWANITNLNIDVDGVTVNSTTLGGSSIPNTSNDWFISVPYFDYFYIYNNGTQEAWYQPNTMVLTTNLVDRTGNGHTGTITWGTNPSGIEVTVGGMQPFAAYTAVDEDDEAIPNVLPDSGDIPTDETKSAAGTGLFLEASFTRASVSLGWTLPVTYWVFLTIVAIVMGVGGALATHSIWGFAALFGSTSAFFGAMRDSTGSLVIPIGFTIACVIISILLVAVWRNN